MCQCSVIFWHIFLYNIRLEPVSEPLIYPDDILGSIESLETHGLWHTQHQIGSPSLVLRSHYRDILKNHYCYVHITLNSVFLSKFTCLCALDCVSDITN